MNELQLFRQGHDTLQIAHLTKQTEADVYNKMHDALTAEYHQRQADRPPVIHPPKLPKRLPYAGYDPFERTSREWRR